ncbi:MAG TPA: hypothetical protein DIT64_15435 [Verrucomicrobiales bacterium]|nr:hypothetical protein [Verrucomicrobiales bacterium]
MKTRQMNEALMTPHEQVRGGTAQCRRLRLPLLLLAEQAGPDVLAGLSALMRKVPPHEKFPRISGFSQAGWTWRPAVRRGPPGCAG